MRVSRIGLVSSVGPVSKRCVCRFCQVRALTLGRPHHDALKELINKKEIVGDLLNQLRCVVQHTPKCASRLFPLTPFLCSGVVQGLCF